MIPFPQTSYQEHINFLLPPRYGNVLDKDADDNTDYKC